jgi:hypothetical protein
MGEFLGTRVKEVDTAAVRTNPDTSGDWRKGLARCVAYSAVVAGGLRRCRFS